LSGSTLGLEPPGIDYWLCSTIIMLGLFH